MFKVLAIFIAGYLLASKIKFLYRFEARMSSFVMWSIYILLFLLGVEIGNDDILVNSLATLGLKALVISSLSILGSVIAALFFYKIFFKKN